MKKKLIVLLAFAMLVSLHAPAADAAFPGRNGRIFFQACDGFCWADGPDPDIFSIRADGTGLRRLTKNDSHDRLPSVSPDGRQLVFNCKGGNRSLGHICVMDVDGTARVQLTSDPDRSFGYPSWSPDGTEIVFVDSGESDRLMTMQADGSNMEVLLDRGLLGINYPKWSPDGTQIIYTGLRAAGILALDVFRFDLSTQEETNLTQSEPDESNVAWSPFGQRILYTRNSSGYYSKLYSMASDGTDIHRVSTETVSFVAPSPNGKQLAFASARTSNLMVMNRDGSGVERLTRRFQVIAPDWQPLER